MVSKLCRLPVGIDAPAVQASLLTRTVLLFKKKVAAVHESQSINTALLSPLASLDQLGLCAWGQGLDRGQGAGMDETDVTLT